MAEMPTPSMQRVKFTIYPDGRVEETVIGVKGQECLKITETLNAKLGDVILTKSTEEMQEVKETVQEQVKVKNVAYQQQKSEW